jgi:hypothetical protein
MRASLWRSENNKLHGVAVACYFGGLDFVVCAKTTEDAVRVFEFIYEKKPRLNQMRPVTIERKKPEAAKCT